MPDFPTHLSSRSIALPRTWTPRFVHETRYCPLTHILTCAHRVDDITGKLIQASTEQLALELGLPGSPFSHDYKHFGCLATTSWIAATWAFVSMHKITLQSPVMALALQHAHDQFLMEPFWTTGVQGTTFRAVNCCHLFCMCVLSPISFRVLAFGCCTGHGQDSHLHFPCESMNGLFRAHPHPVIGPHGANPCFLLLLFTDQQHCCSSSNLKVSTLKTW